MPQPMTHALVIEAASKGTGLEEKVKQLADEPGRAELLDNTRNYGRAGSILAIDGGYMKDAIRTTHPELDFTKVADIIHAESSLRFYSAMLNFIKWIILEPIVKVKLKAFADGAYSHAVTDALFHPFVYRLSQDHWREHFPKEAFKRHKKLESLIDAYLTRALLGIKPTEYCLPEKIAVHSGNDFRAIDRNIVLMLLHAIYETYGKPHNSHSIFDSYGIDYRQYFGAHPVDGKHPIADTYHDMMDLVTMMYRPHERIRRLVQERPRIYAALEAFPEIGVFMPIVALTDRQILELKAQFTKYTIVDLFELAIKATRRIITESERFVHSKDVDAYEFFRKNSRGVVFLDDDYNLDAGLPARMNPELINLDGEIPFLKQNPKQRTDTLRRIFEFGLPQLNANYRKIEDYV